MPRNLSEQITAIRESGYTVLEGLIDADTIGTIKSELAPYLQKTLMGRNNFEGFDSERVYALLAKAPSVAKLVEHEAIIAQAATSGLTSNLPIAQSVFRSSCRRDLPSSSMAPFIIAAVRIDQTPVAWRSHRNIVSPGCDNWKIWCLRCRPKKRANSRIGYRNCLALASGNPDLWAM
mgnify:CR=1 FL=1